MTQKNIVIAGGGIAGIELATRLSKSLRRSAHQIHLIDKSQLHTWKPMLHMFAAGSTTPQEQGISFVNHAKSHHLQYHPGQVVHIDRPNKTLTLSPYDSPLGINILPERTLEYDYLILCLGSCANDYGTPGIKEHAHTIDDLKQATDFFEKLTAITIKAATNKQKYPIVVVGAGPTGVELCGEMMRFLETASAYTDEPLTRYVDITLVQGDNRILPTFTEDVSQHAQLALEKVGVRVILNQNVTSVSADSLILSNGEQIDAYQTVWTAGVKAPALMSSLEGVELTRTQQLVVNDHFQATTDPTLFAIGDCSSVKSNPLPPTAQVARQQAIYLSDYFLDIILGQTPKKPFHYQDNGSLVTIGRYASFGVFGGTGRLKGRSFKGLAASIAHISLYRLHQMTVLGFWRSAAAWSSEKLNQLAKR
ncbi:MAG: NAD(P)/FAD-dependent oxidoreductase [Neisseriaceae bacterium]|nr:NAD(P)/FAD-dependent oxidoreductase [Neisseriaceae bacterium]MBP6862611.1 NAD(P)/FAD-dependent oxidoreductase [Neisseriaceae bacterium]